MISKQELGQLLTGIESDRVERTTSTTDTNKFAEAICAFSNDLPGHRIPGYLIVGARDNGELAGLTVTEDLLQRLAGIRSDGNVQPLPLINVAKFELEGGEIAVVEVHPSDLPPVRYKGRVYIRIGPRRGVASESEERLLAERRLASFRTFDAAPCQGATLDDLALDLLWSSYLHSAVAPEVLEQNNRDQQVQLASLRFYSLARQCPTNAGMLMFGKDPLQWLPGAYVQFLRFSGPSQTDDVVEEKVFNGDLFTVLKNLDDFVGLLLTKRRETISPLRERIVMSYPRRAVRELLMNAVMHRTYEATAPVRFYWYDDHIEIQNPGGLFGEATPENFPRQNSYRNPVISEAMKVLGYVNRFGRGVVVAQEALRKDGHPPPDFEFGHGHFLVTVRGSA